MNYEFQFSIQGFTKFREISSVHVLKNNMDSQLKLKLSLQNCSREQNFFRRLEPSSLVYYKRGVESLFMYTVYLHIK